MVCIGAPNTRQIPTDLRSAAVNPTLVKLAIGVDLDTSEILVPEFLDSLLALVLEKACRPIDMRSEEDPGALVGKTEYLLDTTA